MEAADFQVRRERLPHVRRRPGRERARHERGVRQVAVQRIEVRVVVERVDLGLHFGAGAVDLHQAVLAVGVQVRHAVLVDVAQVVRRAPFAREDRFQVAVGVGVRRVVEVILARQRDFAHEALRVRECGRIGAELAVRRVEAHERARVGADFVADVDDPAVEEAVEQRQAGRRAVAEELVGVAQRDERRRRRRLVERVDVAVGVLLVLRRQGDAFAPDVAGAEAVRVHVDRGEGRQRRVVAAVRVHVDVLRRIDHEVEVARRLRAVLVRHRQRDRLRARRGERELELAACRNGALVRRRAGRNRRRLALHRQLDLRRRRHEVALDVADRPRTRVLDADRRLVGDRFVRLARHEDLRVDVLRIHRERLEVLVEFLVRDAVGGRAVRQDHRRNLDAVLVRGRRAVEEREVDVLLCRQVAGGELEDVDRDIIRRGVVVVIHHFRIQVQRRQRERIGRLGALDQEADLQLRVAGRRQPDRERARRRADVRFGISRHSVVAARGDLHARRRVHLHVDGELLAVVLHVLVHLLHHHAVAPRRLEGEALRLRQHAARHRVRIAAHDKRLRRRRAVVERPAGVERALRVGWVKRFQVCLRGLVRISRELAFDALRGRGREFLAARLHHVRAVHLHVLDRRLHVDGGQHQRPGRIARVRRVARAGVGRVVGVAGQRLFRAQEDVERHQRADGRAVLQDERRLALAGLVVHRDRHAARAVRRQRVAGLDVLRRLVVRRIQVGVKRRRRRILRLAQVDGDLQGRAFLGVPLAAQPARHRRVHLRRLLDVLHRKGHDRRLRPVRRRHEHLDRRIARPREDDLERVARRRAVQPRLERRRLVGAVAAARRVGALVGDRVAGRAALLQVRVGVDDRKALERERLARERARELQSGHRRNVRRRPVERQLGRRPGDVIVVAARAVDRRRQDDAVFRRRARAAHVHVEAARRPARIDRHRVDRLRPARALAGRRKHHVVVRRQVQGTRPVRVARGQLHLDGLRRVRVRLAQHRHQLDLVRLVVAVRRDRAALLQVVAEADLEVRLLRLAHRNRPRHGVGQQQPRLVEDVGLRVRHVHRRRGTHGALALDPEGLGRLARQKRQLQRLGRVGRDVVGLQPRHRLGAAFPDFRHGGILRPHPHGHRARRPRAADRHRGKRHVHARRPVLVDRPPHARIGQLVFVIVVAVEVDGLDIEARLGQRLVHDPRAVLRLLHVVVHRGLERQLRRRRRGVAVQVEAPGTRVQQLVGKVFVARRVRAFAAGRRQHHRQRKVAVLRLEAEHEVAQGGRRIELDALVRRLAQFARHVDVEARLALVKAVQRNQLPLGRRAGGGLHETHLEVAHLAAADWIRHRRDRGRLRRLARRIARQDFVNVPCTGRQAHRQCRRHCQLAEYVLHRLTFPSALNSAVVRC